MVLKRQSADLPVCSRPLWRPRQAADRQTDCVVRECETASSSNGSRRMAAQHEPLLPRVDRAPSDTKGHRQNVCVCVVRRVVVVVAGESDPRQHTHSHSLTGAHCEWNGNARPIRTNGQFGRMVGRERERGEERAAVGLLASAAIVRAQCNPAEWSQEGEREREIDC